MFSFHWFLRWAIITIRILGSVIWRGLKLLVSFYISDNATVRVDELEPDVGGWRIGVNLV